MGWVLDLTVAGSTPTTDPLRGERVVAAPAGTLGELTQEYRTFVTIEEGTVVNGFGAYLSEVMQTTFPEARVIALGVPDRLIEQAPRAEQLEMFGLTAQGIARRIRTLSSEESIAAR